MKRSLFILVVMSFLLSCGSTKKYFTDANEWGFKGKVKQVVSKRYFNLVKYNHWIVDEDEMIYITKMNFDNQGKLISIIDSSTTTKYNPFYRKYIYNHKKLLTTGYKVYDIAGKEIGSSEIKWQTKYKYEGHTYFTDRPDYEVDAYTILDKNFRQSKGGYVITQKEIITKKYFENTLDKYGVMILSSKIDTIIEDGFEKISKYNVILEDIKLDTRHNLIQFATVNAKTGELKEFIARTIEYYNE